MDSLDLSHSFAQPRSKRSFLRGLAGVLVTGVSLSGPRIRQPYSESMEIPAAKPLPKAPPVLVVEQNQTMHFGFDLSKLPRPGQPLKLFHGMIDGKDADLADYEMLANQSLIPASMHKLATAMFILDGCFGRINAYSDADALHPGEQNVSPATRPLMSIDDEITVTQTASRLNCADRAPAGRKLTIRQALKEGLEHSDNGLMESLAHHYGEVLIKNGLEADDGKPGAPHRAFVKFMKRSAEAYGLSPQFNPINAHGLPGYETLVDVDAYQAWAKNNPDQPFEFAEDHHFRRKQRKLRPFKNLGAESGVCATPMANNIWGLFDGPRIIAHLLARYSPAPNGEDLYANLLKNYADRVGKFGAGYNDVHGKSGYTFASQGNQLLVGRRKDVAVCSLVCGQTPVRTRVDAAAKILQIYDEQNPALKASAQPTPTVTPTPAPVEAPKAMATAPKKPTWNAIQEAARNGKLKFLPRLTRL